MRKVMFKKWIPRLEEKVVGGSKPVEGTNCWESDFVNPGTFHQWASAYESNSESFGNYTVALIELPDGTMQEVLPGNVKFITPD